MYNNNNTNNLLPLVNNRKKYNHLQQKSSHVQKCQINITSINQHVTKKKNNIHRK